MNKNTDYFVVGGTLSGSVPSYVIRPADDELYAMTKQQELCAVLTARQMGKSSLMLRTDLRLQGENVSTVQIDLRTIGKDEFNRWYISLLSDIADKLNCDEDVEAWWWDHQHLGASHRFINFMHDVILETTTEPLVIFIDEIDLTLNLDFRSDFFVAIRSMYNKRASEPAYQRLTFVLIGRANPTDLINDPERTPFNVGRRIDLHEFTADEAAVLSQGLEQHYPEQGQTILSRILYWTHGHPYLTQKVCRAVIQHPQQHPWDDERVDALVHTLFLSDEGRKEDNFKHIQKSVAAMPDDERRRMLHLYRDVYNGKTVLRDDSRIQNTMELYGLVRKEGNALHIRNEIYRHIFDATWITENTPRAQTPLAAIVSSSVAVLLVLLVVLLLVFQTPDADVLQETYTNDFKAAETHAERLDALANLFNLGPQYHEHARRLFYEHDLTLQEQLSWFIDAPESMGQQVATVVEGVYVSLDTMENRQDRALMQAMCDALDGVTAPETSDVRNEINAWKQGRDASSDGDYEQAVSAYSTAIALNNDHPVTHFDRAEAYIALEQYEDALGDLDDTVRLAMEAAPTATPTSTAELSATVTLTATYPSVTSSLQPTVITATITTTSEALSTPIAMYTRFIDAQSIQDTVEEKVRNYQVVLYDTWRTASAEGYTYLKSSGVARVLGNNNEETSISTLTITSVPTGSPIPTPTTPILTPTTPIPTQSPTSITRHPIGGGGGLLLQKK